MVRKLVVVAVTVLALGCVAIGSSNAFSSIADAASGMAFSKVDFDQTFTAVGAALRPENTPTNREKLRAAGWKLLQAQ